MIQREEYLNKLLTWKEKKLIKVLTGVRRCGKSTLFLLYIDYLKNNGINDEQIVYINLEDLNNADLLDYKILYNYILTRLVKDQYTYIFIDEVQQCKEFEKVVDSLYIKDRVDIYITGSNANMLSGELATLLSGRYIEIKMLPLSFKEYLDFTNQDKKEGFNDYLRYGSFPYVTELAKNDTIIRTYIEGIYNTILIKDIVSREEITDVALLETIIKFLASNIGSVVSAKKISDTIKSSGRKISVNTVDNYLRSLNQSYIFYKVDRYDIKGKQYLKTLSKYYLVDTGLCNILLTTESIDLGHQIENVVYFELLRRGYRVNIGKLAEKEVNFVASDAKGIIYFQVAASVLDPRTLERELAPLQKIPDYHPKILLTLDDIMAGNNHDGIRQYNLIDWLLKNEQ